MMNVYEGLDTYKTYIALRNHFKQDSYDFYKYNGKTRVNGDSFLKRKDRFFFAKLERKLSKDERVYFFVSNFVVDDSSWAGSLVTNESMTVYGDWKKRIQSMSYLFAEECEKLKLIVDSSGKMFDNLFQPNGSHPALLKLYLQKEISLETMVIIDRILGYSKAWNEHYTDDIVWDNVGKMIAKYSSFIDVDLNKYKATMQQVFTS